MTDYAQEQADELEALTSIFADDLEEVTDEIPVGWNAEGPVWRVVVAPQQDAEQARDYPLKVELVFAHTPNYPDEPPLLKARGVQGISDADVSVLQGVLEDAVQDNLGMAMVYTCISIAQDWMQAKAENMAMPSTDPEVEEKRRREAEEERLAELRRHGHPVTPEAFAEWKAKFDAELALERAKLDGGKSEEKAARLSGKQFFLQQEAAHLEVEEPELEGDEEDGEVDRSHWEGAEEEEEEDLDFEEEDDDSEEEDLLDELLAGKGS